MPKRPYVLVGMFVLGGLLVLGGVAAAPNLDLQDGPFQPPTPSVPNPTDRSEKMKAEDAARPTPTAVPPVATCPAAPETCEFGLLLLDSLVAGQNSLLALASPVSVDCPTNGSRVALQPVCAMGGLQSGYFTGAVGKTWGFYDIPRFLAFVTGTIAPSSHPRLVAIGCPYADGKMDCGAFVAYAYSGDAGQTLVLITLRDGNGAQRVIGARRSVFDAPEVRGGPALFGQPGLPYQGVVYFQPLSMP